MATPSPYNPGLRRLEQMALAGDAAAANDLGVQIWAGITERDVWEAERWFRMAATRDAAPAMFNLAILLQKKQQNTEAFAWFLKAAQQGDKEATYNVAVSYESGCGVQADFRSAISCYQKAAQLGHTNALLALGLFRIKGQAQLLMPADKRAHQILSEVLPLDIPAGIKDLEAAARLGSPEAKYYLGGTYAGMVQRGPAIDWEKAEYWTIQAAEAGYRDAYYNAAISLEARNFQRAIHFYVLAAQAGDQAALQRLKDLGIFEQLKESGFLQ